MPAAPLPPDEADRIEALRRSGVLESGDDPRLDDIVRRAAAVAGTSVAAISLVTGSMQRFKAATGFGVPHTARDVSFCAYVLLDPGPLVALDMRQDPRFADNPLVYRAPGIHFYIGMPIFGGGRQPFGALFAIDLAPRTEVSASTLASFQALADEASQALATAAAVIGLT